MPLIDQHGRIVNYVRLAVTDRCNLRCQYCMPAEGIDYVDRKELLTYEEMERLVQLLAKEGVNKVRITGGEPFLRKGMLGFMERLSNIEGISKLHITTNGTLTRGIIPDLQKMGVAGVNVSLDTLDRAKFFEITRRDNFEEVLDTLYQLVDHGINTKINMVVMKDHNLEDIHRMVELTQILPIAVRFIEEMPFNGTGEGYSGLEWNHKRILNHIMSAFPDVEKLQDGPYSTSSNFKVNGFQGSFGIIAAYSRTFCGTCNRIRITPTGILKTCLYDQGVFSIRDVMRNGANDQQVIEAVNEALSHKAVDGKTAERQRHNLRPVQESMATIGG